MGGFIAFVLSNENDSLKNKTGNKNPEQNITNEKAKDNKQKTGGETIKEADKENYEEYLGIWHDYGNAGEETLHDYLITGQNLEIVGVSEDAIVFNIENYVNVTHFAHLDYVKVKLVDGKAAFHFTNDGRGNSGQGTIELKDGTVRVKIEIADSDKTDVCSIAMDTEFVRVFDMYVNSNIDVKELMWKDIQVEKGYFGERTGFGDTEEGPKYTYQNAVGVTLHKSGIGFITSVEINYDKLEGPLNYNYDGVDNTYTKEMVEEKYNCKISNRTYLMHLEEEEIWLDIFFDSDWKVESICVTCE